MSLIPAILQKLDNSDVDLIVAHTTPLLTACTSMVKNKPVVFTEVYDPIAAGTGTSSDEHAAHITGVGESLGHPARITFLALSESIILARAYDGLLQGFEETGLSVDTDFVIRKLNAQTDMSQLTLMAQSVRKSDTDLVITSTTPAMIAAAQQIKAIPIVFFVASYPPAVGVFAEGERQANLVGVYDDPRIKELIELTQRREGILKTVGTVWHPAEPNSAISVRKLREVCEEKKIRLIEKQINTPSDLPDATTAACLAGDQIIVISADNLTSSGLPAILTAARKQKVPIYSTEPDMVNRGVEAAIGDDFGEWGKQSAHLAARVLAGVPVDALDMEKTKVERTLTVDDLPK